MKVNQRMRIAAGAAAIGLGLIYFFFWGSTEIGDGKLTDNGPFAATDRYIVDLGSVDLAKKESHTYRLRNLPLEVFACGLELSMPGFSGERLYDDKPLNALVSFELTDSAGKVLIKESAPLRKWGWAYKRGGTDVAFVYPHYSEDSMFFKPTKGGSYQLTVVVEPDGQSLHGTARILMKSGGWK